MKYLINLSILIILIYFLKYIIILFELLIFECLINIRNKSASISNKYLMNNKSKIINNIKRNLSNIIKKFKKNNTHFNTLYIRKEMRFGNYFVSLNNAIIFCEFLGCKRIIINSVFIKHNIFYPEYKII